MSKFKLKIQIVEGTYSGARALTLDSTETTSLFRIEYNSTTITYTWLIEQVNIRIGPFIPDDALICNTFLSYRDEDSDMIGISTLADFTMSQTPSSNTLLAKVHLSNRPSTKGTKRDASALQVDESASRTTHTPFKKMQLEEKNPLGVAATSVASQLAGMGVLGAPVGMKNLEIVPIDQYQLRICDERKSEGVYNYTVYTNNFPTFPTGSGHNIVVFDFPVTLFEASAGIDFLRAVIDDYRLAITGNIVQIPLGGVDFHPNTLRFAEKQNFILNAQPYFSEFNHSNQLQ